MTGHDRVVIGRVALRAGMAVRPAAVRVAIGPRMAVGRCKLLPGGILARARERLVALSGDEGAGMSMLDQAGWLTHAATLMPGILPAEEYVARTTSAARSAGFASGETLPLVATCRDELMIGFTELVDRNWGPHFAIGALGGLVLAGVSGIAAAVGHAPTSGQRHFVLYCMPHVGLDEDGVVGKVRRPGQQVESAACGALVMFQREVQSGRLRLEYDRTDPEMSLLRTRLAPGILGGGVPDLLTLTAQARDVALADITEIGGMTGDGRGAVAVFTGIVVHGPHGRDFVAPHHAELRWPRDSGRAWEPLAW